MENTLNRLFLFLIGALAGAFVFACWAAVTDFSLNWLLFFAISIPIFSGLLSLWKGDWVIEFLLSIGPI
jgi:hypothetical protein